jgi:hypothetical protein
MDGSGAYDSMNTLIRSPFVVAAFSMLLMWLSARIGTLLRTRHPNLESDARQDLDLITAATLTLLGLIIGFSFSMAISRYDQRKACEESEANAIGTEYVRTGVLPAADGLKVRGLLKAYLDQRVLFYTTRDSEELRLIAGKTTQLQNDLWTAVQAPAMAQQTPVVALALSGMNDVLNSQGYTQAAWWNRIPIAAWGLMIAIAICSNLLIGYGRRRVKAGDFELLVLPLVLAIAFFLVGDIDSPRRGIIRVSPQNLVSLVQSLQSQ